MTTTITVDPGELTATADLLRAGAAEAADIGTALWACADCPMPAQLRPLVDQLVASADRALDVSAMQLGSWANDLTNRAQIAYTDALTAASITSGYSGPPTVPLVGGAGLIGGSFGTANVTIGAGGGPSTGGYGTPLIGGGFGTYNVTIGDGTTPYGSGAPLIGGVDRSGDLLSRVENNPQLVALFGHMNDVSSFGINQRLSPSLSGIRRDNPGLPDTYIASMFPYAGSNPYVSMRIPGLG